MPRPPKKSEDKAKAAPVNTTTLVAPPIVAGLAATGRVVDYDSVSQIRTAVSVLFPALFLFVFFSVLRASSKGTVIKKRRVSTTIFSLINCWVGLASFVVIVVCVYEPFT